MKQYTLNKRDKWFIGFGISIGAIGVAISSLIFNYANILIIPFVFIAQLLAGVIVSLYCVTKRNSSFEGV